MALNLLRLCEQLSDLVGLWRRDRGAAHRTNFHTARCRQSAQPLHALQLQHEAQAPLAPPLPSPCAHHATEAGCVQPLHALQHQHEAGQLLLLCLVLGLVLDQLGRAGRKGALG